MAEKPDSELEAKKEKKKGGKLKWIIIAVVALGLLGGGGYFAYTKFFAGAGDGAAGEDKATADAKGEDSPGEEKLGKTAIVSLPTFVVNLADPLGRRYLKLGVDVEVMDEAASQELTAATPKVRDTVILLLSSKTFADLTSMESKLLLKKEIVERLNQVMGGSKVLRVYITEMVIQ
jgi:flagellar FliL protein